MTRIRVLIAATFAWMLLLFNIERFHEPINIASFVYVYAACVAIAIVALPSLRNIRTSILLSVALVMFLALKWVLGYNMIGAHLPLTITEACAVCITTLASRSIAWSIERFEEGVADVWSMHPNGLMPQFEDNQVEFYREVRRARQFKRPLSLLALESDDKDCAVAINYFIKELQAKMARKYVDSRIGRIISERTKDCDMIAYSDDHFVLLLPEVDGMKAEDIVNRINEAAEKEVGVSLRIGKAVFPDEELTLSGMLDRAVSEMRSKRNDELLNNADLGSSDLGSSDLGSSDLGSSEYASPIDMAVQPQ